MSNPISVVFSCLVMWLTVFLLVVFGKVPESPNSFLDHKLHRKSTEVGTSWRPLRLREGRTHLGSINSFNQACSEFSSSTCLIVAERTRANEGLDFFGINRKVHLLKRRNVWIWFTLAA